MSPLALQTRYTHGGGNIGRLFDRIKGDGIATHVMGKPHHLYELVHVLVCQHGRDSNMGQLAPLCLLVLPKKPYGAGGPVKGSSLSPELVMSGGICSVKAHHQVVPLYVHKFTDDALFEECPVGIYFPKHAVLFYLLHQVEGIPRIGWLATSGEAPEQHSHLGAFQNHFHGALTRYPIFDRWNGRPKSSFAEHTGKVAVIRR